MSVQVVGLSNTVQVEGDSFFSCARLMGGAVQCWGQNDSGQLGDGTNTDHRAPAPVVGMLNAAQIALGFYHACARVADGSEPVLCWGANTHGQLGDGTILNRNAPVAVMNVMRATQIAGGFDHTCALLSGGTVRCWGSNASGQLGVLPGSSTPVAVVWR